MLTAGVISCRGMPSSSNLSDKDSYFFIADIAAFSAECYLRRVDADAFNVICYLITVNTIAVRRYVDNIKNHGRFGFYRFAHDIKKLVLIGDGFLVEADDHKRIPGILGMGRVGRRVGSIAANGFGMRVIYNDVLDVQPHLTFPATAVEKTTLFREADIITLHVDMKPGNQHLVGTPLLSLMKTTAILINTSRGEILDDVALAAAIREKKIAGAAIDVFDPEPPRADYPLLGFDNVLLSPHMAARTYTAIENMSWVVRDVVEVLNGGTPKYPAP